jgi:hypothetical protein
MVALDAVRPNLTMTVAVDADQLTSPRTPPVKPHRKGAAPAWHRRRSTPQTGLDVDPAERGDEEEQNQASTPEADQGRTAKEQERIEDGEGGRVRSEQARGLVQRVDQLLPLIGDVSLATHITLLKRDLSRCHDALNDHPGETNYLSIVTLVESAMTQLKWRQYTRPQLEAIRQVLDIGYQQVWVRFEDYEKARTLLSRSKVDVTPRIDLESLKWEDIADEEG